MTAPRLSVALLLLCAQSVKCFPFQPGSCRGPGSPRAPHPDFEGTTLGGRDTLDDSDYRVDIGLDPNTGTPTVKIQTVNDATYRGILVRADDGVFAGLTDDLQRLTCPPGFDSDEQPSPSTEATNSVGHNSRTDKTGHVLTLEGLTQGEVEVRVWLLQQFSGPWFQFAGTIDVP
ncbi:unnamed protein product [Vitrella brassicaformis CCMP3155]|uniref:Reelin domain-containing protein n=1 Tax=Vitrella brassicaformis (strain CCMP3155) TaxID=1169540 RepID=A0A0G4EX50_VITBC|nr:unnamed protein product [Vitrella brassicaformis CCMP3155]|eukprot:CEM03577.1 unnamed protein product [Vitrella brassicaformis CCMP3155]